MTKGSVWPPLPREQKDDPMDYNFGKAAKEERVKTAKESSSVPAARAAAVIAAHNDIAVVNFLETYLPSVQKMFEYMLYVHDTATWSLRDERIEMLALLRRLRVGMSKGEMKEAVEDALGEQVENLTDPDESNVPDLKVSQNGGTRRAYCEHGKDNVKLLTCTALRNSLADETPMLTRQTRQLCLLQRNELIRLMADAQARVEPLIKETQLKTAQKRHSSAMPKDDKQAVSKEKRFIAVTSPKKDKKQKTEHWGGGGRGNSAYSRGKQHQRYSASDNPNTAPNNQDQKDPKGKPNGKGKPWKKKFGKGRGKGRGK